MSTRNRLLVAIVLSAFVAALELWGGIRANSLALVSDAAHVCMDVIALVLALAAVIGSQRPADRRRTFGYGRIEVLGAPANGTLLLGATIVIVVEALRRFGAPVESNGHTMSAIASIGLAVNAAAGFLLAMPGGAGHGHSHDLNVRAALFHIFGDALGAVAVIVGGIAIALTHLQWIDPLLSLFVAAVIVVGVLRVLRDASDVLLEGAPRDVDTAKLESDIGKIGGVAALHDLHVWAIGSDSYALSAHVILDDLRISEAASILTSLQTIARDRYHIAHVTVQLECEHCDPEGVFVCAAVPNP